MRTSQKLSSAHGLDGAGVRRFILTSLVMLGLLCVGAPVALAAQPPLILDESVSGVTQTSAIFDTTIDPEGQSTTYRFEYVSQAAYETSGYATATSVPVPEGDAGAGAGETVEGQQLTGLQPATAYHYRVIATSNGGVTEGAGREFRTLALSPPFAATLPAVEVSQQTAALAGSIDSRGLPTIYEFDLGTDTNYSTRIFGEADTNPGIHTYTVTLRGFAPSTTYHYRLLATNTDGVVYGTDQQFTTQPYPTSILTAPPTPPLLPAPQNNNAPSITPIAQTIHVQDATARLARHTIKTRMTRTARSASKHRHAHPIPAHPRHG
jgi:phosphodiesterase/alkaline phosphatase D-like protein